MRRPQTLRVLDRALVLFGSRGDLSAVGQHAVPIGTVGAVQAFQKVQILQTSAIENEIVRAADLRHSIDRAADALVDAEEQIEEKKRNDAGVDDGRRQVRQKSSMQKVGWEPMLSLPMPTKHGLFEAGFPPDE